MKLLSLRLRGLRSFPDPITVDFARLGEQGLFAIVGPTGAGKSTILDGIFLALFGRSPRGEASECVSPGSTELVVRLEFEHGDPPREFAVERAWRWSRRRDGADLDVRGSARHSPVRVEIREGEGFRPVDFAGQKPEAYLSREIVRVSMDDFQQAVVLPQGAFDALLLARPAERRALVASLFRTEHLGQPLADVLRRRETEAKGEIERLAEAEREIAVSEDDVRRAHEAAEWLGARAASHGEALERAERFVVDVRRARDRAAARDAAAAAVTIAERRAASLAGDRERAASARRALAAVGPIDEFDEADLVAGEAEARDAEARQAAHEAVARLRTATRELVEARAERDRRSPELGSRLGKARLAAERERPLEAQREEAHARADALARADAVFVDARAAKVAAQRAFEIGEAKTREVAAKLEATRVSEVERTEALASVAFAERAVAQARLEQAERDERATAAALALEAKAAFEAAEQAQREVEHAAGAASVDVARCRVDDERAAHEVALAARALDEARTRGAAAALAESLRPGAPCPVCGARDHRSVDHGAASALLDATERALASTERAHEWTKRALTEASSDEQARGEELRAASARAEEAAASAKRCDEFLLRLESGAEVPRGVLEARTALERASTRVSLASAALLDEARERLEASVPSIDVAEARAAELAVRARSADALRALVREAQAFEAGARAALAVREQDVGRSEIARSLAVAEAEAATRAVASNEREVALLLLAAEPEGQRDLFDASERPTTAAGWVLHLESEIARLATRADAAEAALDAARDAEAHLALEAREATGRKLEASRALVRARASAAGALARTGFRDADAVRAARLDLAELEALETALASADAELARVRAVLEARSRDVSIEIAADEAALAESALADLRRAAARAADEAAGARERDGELARRRARSIELRARIAELTPRAERIARIRAVTAGGVLSELAAERHLEAVTRAAAELLLSISEGRYSLVRRPDGAFAVVDGAHGGLVRLPSTLSGGETFLVSLALALALSDRIQVAGRTRFDFFFLDEGFGSLDAATLDLALGALERVRDMGRVIGMISHVPAVEERMPRRLRVVPGRPRGRARVVLET